MSDTVLPSSSSAIVRVARTDIAHRRRAEELDVDEVIEIFREDNIVGVFAGVGGGSCIGLAALLFNAALPPLAVVVAVGALVTASTAATFHLTLSNKRFADRCVRFGLDASEAKRLQRAHRRAWWRYLSPGDKGANAVLAEATLRALAE